MQGLFIVDAGGRTGAGGALFLAAHTYILTPTTSTFYAFMSNPTNQRHVVYSTHTQKKTKSNKYMYY